MKIIFILGGIVCWFLGLIVLGLIDDAVRGKSVPRHMPSRKKNLRSSAKSADKN